MFELAVPVQPIVIPPLQTYEDVRQVMYGIGLHWQDVSAAQLGNMESLKHLVTTTITRRAGEGFSRFVISTPESAEDSDLPGLSHLELWPSDELRLIFPSDSAAYTIDGRCETVQDLASIGTWYLLATQRFSDSVTPHSAQAAYNAAISKWNEKPSQRNTMKAGTESALLGLIHGTLIYGGNYTESTQETKNNQYLVNKVSIDWGSSIENCLKTWR